MRVLFDHGTPVPLRLIIENYTVSTAYELGWWPLPFINAAYLHLKTLLVCSARFRPSYTLFLRPNLE
jgi:hypothetical protein